MGCSSGKNKATEAVASPTLLDAPAGKPVQEEATKQPQNIAVFADAVSASACLVANEDGSKLLVGNVVGGPFGLWNNRANTEKVAVGDMIVRVRVVAPEAVWVEADAKKMIG